MAQLEKGQCLENEEYQVQFGTRATMHNRTSKLMKLDRFINWHGRPSMGSFPATIPHVGDAKFVHMRDGQLGSMAAVQYTASANKDGRDCSWIMAWHAPSDNDKHRPNRVYVICGTKYRMDNISWDQILLNLELSGDSSKHFEPYSHTTADAKIDDKVADIATLNANFAFNY